MSKVEKKVSVLDAIHERRSVRAYSPQRLDQATVRRKLLDAAVWAPTAVHEEPWAFASCRTWRRSRVSRIALKRFSLRRPDAPPLVRRVICWRFSTIPTSIFSITPAR